MNSNAITSATNSEHIFSTSGDSKSPTMTVSEGAIEDGGLAQGNPLSNGYDGQTGTLEAPISAIENSAGKSG